MRSCRLNITWSILLAVVIYCGLAAASSAETEINEKFGGRRNIALLPMVNFSGKVESSGVIGPVIEQALAASGIGVVLPHELRPLLRKHRIRAVGMIGSTGAEAIAAETGIEYLLIGSIDFYDDSNNPAAGFSLRLVDIKKMRPIWAVSTSASGHQFTGLLGLGDISRVDSLIWRLIDDVADDLKLFLDNYPSNDEIKPTPVVAVVSFDEIDPSLPIGSVTSAYLLTRLVAEGINVIEFGVLHELFLKMGRVPRGEIDHKLLKALRDSLNVDMVITGAIDEFRVDVTGSDRTIAEVGLGARLIDTRTLKVLAAEYVIKRSQTDSGLLTGGGYPTGNVISTAVKDLVDRLPLTARQTYGDSI